MKGGVLGKGRNIERRGIGFFLDVKFMESN